MIMVVPQLPPGQGGMERQAYLQAVALSSKISLTVLSISSDPSLFAGVRLNFVRLAPYSGLASKEVNALRLFFAFLTRVSLKKREVIYCHQVNLLTSLILLYCRLFKRRIFIKIANSEKKFDLKVLFQRYPIFRWVSSIFTQKNTSYLSLSRSNRSDFEKLGLGNAKLIEFRNGISVPEIMNTHINGRSICYVGRLEPVKEVDYIFKLKKYLPNIGFKIIGNGSEFEKLNQLSKGFPDIEMLGEMPTEQLPWNDVEWLVLPSKSEGMSNAILEALVKGKGIICRPIAANKFISNLSDKIVWIDGEPQEVAAEVIQRSGFEANISDSIWDYSIEKVTDDLKQIISNENFRN